MRPKFVLSPCGTSLLTNGPSDEQRKLVNQYANMKALEAIPAPDQRSLQNRVSEIRGRLQAASIEDAARMSAELNAIIKLYKGRFNSPGDQHCLLCTDTWIGETTAGLVKSWLEAQGLRNVQVDRIRDLQTADLMAFQLALSDLVDWSEREIEPRRNSYHVVFNLTGGFKAVQGFLQTLAMFYADETIYIFETATELLRIPRLPVKMDAEQIVGDNLTAFRRLANDLRVDPAVLRGIPETLLWTIDGKSSLSPWGDLVWNQTKQKFYKESVHPDVSSRIVFSDSFQRSIRGLAPDRVQLINQRLDQLACYLERPGHPNPRSLDFKKLSDNPRPPSTHEIDAWSDQDAKRIFGHYDGDRFILDKLDRSLH